MFFNLLMHRGGAIAQSALAQVLLYRAQSGLVCHDETLEMLAAIHQTLRDDDPKLADEDCVGELANLKGQPHLRTVDEASERYAETRRHPPMLLSIAIPDQNEA